MSRNQSNKNVMKVQLDYSELKKMFSEKYGKEMVLRRVNDKTATVGLVANLGLFTKEVAVDLQVVRVEGSNDVVLGYGGNGAMGFAMNTLLPLFKSMVPDFGKVLEKGKEDDTFVLHLEAIGKLEKLFKVVTVKSVGFNNDGVVFSMLMK